MGLLNQQVLEITVQVPADNETEALQKAEHLQKIGRLSKDTLSILAKKAQKPGIENKLKMYQSFI